LEIRTLAEVAEIVSGHAWKSKDFKDDSRIGLPIIRIQNVGNHDGDYKYWENDYDEKFLVHKGDILVSLSGSVKIDLWSGPKALLNQRIVKVMPKAGIDNEWLYWSIKSIINDIEKLAKKSIIGNISVTDFKQIKIGVPSYARQKKIAHILQKAQKLVTKRNEQISLLSSLKESIFLDMFGDPASNPRQWPSVKMKEIVEDVDKVNLKQRNDRIAYIDISSIDNLCHEITTYKEYVAYEAPSRAKQEVRCGDILLSTVRPNLKNVAMITVDKDNLIGSSGFCVLRTNEKCHPQFLFYFVKSDYFTNQLMTISTGASYPAVKSRDILEQKMYLPPLELQKQFARLVNKIDHKLGLFKQGLSWLEKQYHALLHRAFHGERFKG
jgi:type I restriction enzyme, S subunit